MRQLNDRAESPIEVGLVIMVSIIVMALLMLIVGSFVDTYIAQIQSLQAQFIPAGSWGESMMTTLVYNNANYIFLTPPFIIIVVVVWGVKTMVKKHQYSTNQAGEIISSEFD